MKLPSNLIEKINDGLISLKNVPTHVLLDWIDQTSDYKIRDVVGCEIMYNRTDVIPNKSTSKN